MNTLAKILKQDLTVANETQKLFELQKQYLKESAKYSIGDILKFKQHENDVNFLIGKVERIYYKDIIFKGLIQYQLTRVKKD